MLCVLHTILLSGWDAELGCSAHAYTDTSIDLSGL